MMDSGTTAAAEVSELHAPVEVRYIEAHCVTLSSSLDLNCPTCMGKEKGVLMGPRGMQLFCEGACNLVPKALDSIQSRIYIVVTLI